ncbi:MAG: hypothetical protein UX01_C0010G0048 [Candidatus Collierbacteria bacterium GW2011_GWB2_45_17]|uniref:Uncharacterized protein n=1 Tax=Candidatus Collierbacteria bacterium GW2011_GWB2_45_17 TaxID=1618388 RepID=A0A837IP93_9BACT|nr:MAG: hypothetical protein UX01_C0010G0048 [Candidatus Collierbacteria bacterium GW2011_GWB2_45_17]
MKRFLFLSLSIFFSLLLVFYLSSRVLAFFKPYLPFTNYLLGIDRPTSYLILLGNDAEMRANGGFAGSYAKLTLSTKRLEFLNPRVLEFFLKTRIPKPTITFEFQDIYVPNGQIAGLFVKPPEPIQQAFGHGTWELANADWEPDFPSSAKTIRWFLEKGREINPDILAILNLSTIKKVLAVVGSFPVPEHSATLTPDNLYLFLQGKAELNFFPGSTQKKDALTAVGSALVKKIKSLSFIQKLRIAQILYTDIIDQNIMIHSTNLSFQSLLKQKKLAGVFQSEAFDTYSMIETNLGANKANAFITRQTNHVISSVAEKSPSTTIHHSVTIQFQNSSIEANPNPPLHYGGNYIAYLRLYIPENAQNISLSRTPSDYRELTSENYDLKSAYGLTEIGFWHTTLAGGESTITLSYTLPNQANYSLAILKQHGLVSSPQTIDLFGQPLATNLTQSFYYP